MDIKHNKLLHFVLIMLLMFAPLRSVFAMQLMACDMDTSSMATVQSPAVKVLSSEHCRHMQGAEATDTVSSNGHQVNRCCDDISSACMADCHFSAPLSLYLQQVEYLPVLLKTETFENVANALIVRELTPPSRPPASLYS
ncbi:MAG: hypothetical protein IMF14_03380 [Proteobacteria bacterium]|nr:hypothetical protein [Pseudomonadota bacterium]